MNETDNIIVILTGELTVGATIVPEGNKPPAPVYDDASVKPQVEKILSYLETHDPKLTIRTVTEDGASFSGYREVPKGDPDYFTAVVDECNRQNLKCIVVPFALYEVFALTLKRLSIEDRKKVLDQCLSMPDQEAVQFCRDFGEALAAGKEAL